jgi:hypothetical protein
MSGGNVSNKPTTSKANAVTLTRARLTSRVAHNLDRPSLVASQIRILHRRRVVQRRANPRFLIAEVQYRRIRPRIQIIDMRRVVDVRPGELRE